MTTGNIQMNGSRGDRSVQLPVKGPSVQQRGFVQWKGAGGLGGSGGICAIGGQCGDIRDELLVLIYAVAARCLVITRGKSAKA